MQGQDEKELHERLALIETMITQGRRTTESWGWIFVLWGIAYYIAILWAAHGGPAVAWPVTMIAAAIVSGLIASRQTRNQPMTTVGHAIRSIWIAMGVALFVLLVSLGWSGNISDVRVTIAIVATMLGVANLASGLLLRWKAQIGSGLMWLAAAVAVCFVAENLVMPLFVAAIFLCQILFGVYGMVCEARARKIRGASHA